MGILYTPFYTLKLMDVLEKKEGFMTELDGRYISGLVPRAKALQLEGRLSCSV